MNIAIRRFSACSSSRISLGLRLAGTSHSRLQVDEHHLRLANLDFFHHSSPKYKLIARLSGSENSNIGQFLLMHCRLDITISPVAAGLIASFPFRAASFKTFLASFSFSFGLRSGRSTETHDGFAGAL